MNSSGLTMLMRGLLPQRVRVRVGAGSVCPLIHLMWAFLLGLVLLLTATPSFASPSAAPASQTEASSFESRLVVLSDQTDGQQFRPARFRSASALRTHHRDFIRALQRMAAETQAPVVNRLELLKACGEVADYQPFWVANVIAVSGTASAFAELEVMPEIGSVERDPLIVPVLPDASQSRGTLDEVTTPIGIRRLRVPEVWATGTTGAGVLVATFDSGVNYTHPSLVGRWRGQCGYPAGQCWRDLVGTTSLPVDAVGHGTQTMSILCGMSTGDTLGVAWGARYIAARLNMSTGATLVSTALTAFQWVIDPDGNPATFDDVPRVLSCSWGLENGVYQPCYDVLSTVIDNVETAGVAVFWAAGNEGGGSGTIRIPADRAVNDVNCFAVGAYDYTNDSVWSLSSRGPSACSADPLLRIKPEVVAPGRNVRTAWPGTGYTYDSGTSYAVPHVAGVAALMLEVNPLLTPDSLKRIILQTAVDKGAPGPDNNLGNGLPDAYWAVVAAAGGMGKITGQVTDAYDWPIEARVTVAGHPQWTVCDTAGRFALPMPAQMPLLLQFSAASYDTLFQEIVLAPGEVRNLEIVLALAGNCGLLTGTVMNCLSEPASGARVWISSDTASVLTDAQGRFRRTLATGTYGVNACDGYCASAQVPGVGVIGRGVTEIEIILPPNPAHLCSEPDLLGYRACDDKDPGGPVFVWNEIAPAFGGSGVVYNLGEDASVLLAAPFPIPFYGTAYQRFFLNSNGNVTLTRSFLEYTNTALPRGLTPAIYPFWDDLSDNYGGDICALYEPGRGTLTIEWSNVPRYDGDGNETFELVVYDPEAYPTSSGNAMIEFRYGNLAVTNESTVGIEGPAGAGYLQYAYNGTYPAHAGALANGCAIRFVAGELLPGTSALSVGSSPIVVNALPGQYVDTSLILVNSGGGPAAYAVSVLGQPFGSYVWTSSRLSGGPVFEFTNIATIGQNLGIAGDDTTTEPLDLPWHFPLYGRYFKRMTVCANGYVSFNSASYDRSWSCSPLSEQRDPYYMLAPYWVDLDVRTGGAVLKYYDPARDRFIIQWNQIRRYGESGPNTYQVILTRDGTVDFVYSALSSPLNNGTVGIKGRNASEYLQLAYRQAFLQSNTLVRIYRSDTTSASCTVRDLPQGVIAAHSTLSIPLRLKNTSAGFGERTWQIALTTSDPQVPALTAQATLQAVGSPADLRLVIAAEESGVRLSWRRVPAPRYCVYSAASVNGPFDTLVASVTDTSIVVPLDGQMLRVFEVRLCDTSP